MIDKVKTNNLAILYMFLCCLSYSLMYSAVKYLTNNSVSPMALVFYRNFLATIITLPFILKESGTSTKIFTSFNRMNFLRGFLSFISIIMSFYAISGMEVNKNVAISFISPVFTCLLALFFFRESLNLYKIIAIILGFLGCCIILQPKFNGINKYELLALASCFTWSSSNIVVKHLTNSQDSKLIIFYSFCTVSLLSLPWIIYDFYLPSIHDFMVLMIIAITSTLAQFFLTKSFSNGDVTHIMPFDFSRLIFSSIISYLLFAEKLTENIFVGSLLIMAGNMLIWHFSKNKKTI